MRVIPSNPALLARQQINIVGWSEEGLGFAPFGPSNRVMAGPYVTTLTGYSLGYSPESGLQIAVDMSLVEGFGYQRVTATLQQQSPAAQDRKIVLRFHAGNWQDQGTASSVEQTAILKRGETSVDMQFSIPKYRDWQAWGWEVFADDRRDRSLTVRCAAWMGQGQSGAVRAWTSIGASGYGLQQVLMSRGLPGIGASQGQNVETVAEDAWPRHWRDYSSVDLVVMSSEELRKLDADRKPQAEALLRWVRSGGSLWIIDFGSPWDSVAASQEVLTARSFELPKSGDGFYESLSRHGWRAVPQVTISQDGVNAARILSGIEAPMRGVGADRKAPGVAEGATPPQPAPSSQDSSDSRDALLVRGYGFGLVAALRTDLDFDQLAGQAQLSLGQSFLATRLNWTERHGNQPDSANIQFNNWLIPGVGVAPVGMFQALITLFVLGIGPLNYWLLQRRRKLPMLLVTAPAAALVTTALLFAYGIFADGVGVQSRVRSLTLIDQRQGELASWSRSTFYAGIAPGEGLIVSPDAVLYPILPDWSSEASYRYRGQRAGRELRWTDRQELTHGWLASRTPTQYLSIQSKPSKRRLAFKTVGEKLDVTNLLGVDVQLLIVQDGEGKTYLHEDLTDGAKATLSAAPLDDSSGPLRRVYSESFTEFPVGADPNSMGQTNYISLSSNLMETFLEAINSPGVESWGDRTYLAFTKRRCDGEFEPDLAREEASFHVIRGAW
jgi:hypothetical protein